MTILKIQAFGGEVPRQPPRALPDGGAQRYQNLLATATELRRAVAAPPASHLRWRAAHGRCQRLEKKARVFLLIGVRRPLNQLPHPRRAPIARHLVLQRLRHAQHQHRAAPTLAQAGPALPLAHATVRVARLFFCHFDIVLPKQPYGLMGYCKRL